MRDEEKNKAQLVNELKKLRRQVSSLKRPATCDTARKGARQAQNLKKLLIASREITTTTDLRRLYRKIVNISKKLLNLDFSTLMILSADRTRLVIEDTIGFPKSMIETFSLVKGQGLATYVVKAKKPATVENFNKEKRFEVPPVVLQRHITSAISVPMMLEKEAFGILIGHTLEKRVFTEDEISLYQSIANQAAMAIKNVMHLKALKESEARYRDLFENANDLIQCIAPDGSFLYVNRAWHKALGYSVEDIKSLSMFDIVHPKCNAHCRKSFQQVLSGGKLNRIEATLVTKEGKEIIVEGSVNCNVVDGKPTATRGIFRDITERKSMEEAIKYQAYHDLLTGLPNRMLFIDRLNLALPQVQRSQKMLAVLFLDIDHFKNINDTLGHTIGDQLLREVAKRLKACIRKSDTVARIGGDEFIMLLSPINDIGDAVIIAEKILLVFQKPFKIDGHTLRVTTSIGLSVYPGDGENAEALLKNSDIAMYYAKDRGRNMYQCFNEAMKG